MTPTPWQLTHVLIGYKRTQQDVPYDNECLSCPCFVFGCLLWSISMSILKYQFFGHK